MNQDLVLILDLGGEDNSRVVRAVRALGVYSEVRAHNITKKELLEIKNLKGIILNGGKNRIVEGKTIFEKRYIHTIGVPVLSIEHSSPYCNPDIGKLPKKDSELLALLEPFLFEKCKAQPNWNMKNFVNDQIELLRKQIGEEKVLLALSGGVDSSVVAALLFKAVGDRLHCVHVNHGMLRKGESEQVIEVFEKQFGVNLIYVDSRELFLNKLKGVSDPEKKRKIIGREFITVFEQEARRLDGIRFLGQGTIYPDIVESGTKTGKAVKAHHNAGGLPKDLKFELVEPLKYLFKDEVRACGKQLGLPDDMVFRQPFPGPGLGVRCLGEITRDRLEAVRESDAILREEFGKIGLDRRVWQYFTLIPDIKSVGVKDGERYEGWAVIIRAVNTVDAMQATIEPPHAKVLQTITNRILNEVNGVNRVLYDLSPKPPATIEWE
ncbi:MAG: GMP synthase (glutamine-hydrolyzing) [Firmicutes bacterium ADurb.Bin300]|nr:MAG: GMP synthase (glutamine-hydrolyzing) [Firmicutes bacterium ADurb.Bin300]HOD02279.1 glutamine-hydrolyzing GMP synthase [Clostridiales bacterium]